MILCVTPDASRNPFGSLIFAGRLCECNAAKAQVHVFLIPRVLSGKLDQIVIGLM